MRLAFTLAFAFTLTAGETKADTSWIGYGGPGGTRVYADAKPPTKFGAGDIAWRAKLVWGHGSPTVIGDKVLVQCEYLEGEEHYPSLVALNTSDGSVA